MTFYHPRLIAHLPPLTSPLKFNQIDLMMRTVHVTHGQAEYKAMLAQPNADPDIYGLLRLKFSSKYAYFFMGEAATYIQPRRDLWERYTDLSIAKEKVACGDSYVAPSEMPRNRLMGLPPAQAPITTRSDALKLCI